mgnify:CR=1 FL=1
MKFSDWISSLGSITIPDKIWECDKLTPVDIKVFYCFLRIEKQGLEGVEVIHDSSGNLILNSTASALKKFAGISYSTLTNSLNRMENAGIVLFDKGKTNVEIVVLKSFFDDCPTPPDNDKKDKEDKGELEEENHEEEKEQAEEQEQPVKVQEEEQKNKENNVIEEAKKKQEELNEKNPFNLSEEEKAILKVARYYEQCVRAKTNRTGQRFLPRKSDPRKNKRWRFFEKLYHICKENGWDYRLYLDAQFERSRNWKKFSYPLPNMLCSATSQKYYQNWIKDKRERMGYEADAEYVKLKPQQEEAGLKRQISKEIQKSAKTMSNYIKSYKNNNDPLYAKLMELKNFSSNYSPFYLYQLEWYRDYFLAFILDETDSVYKRIAETWEMLEKSKNLQEFVLKEIEKWEKKYGIPPTPESPEEAEICLAKQSIRGKWERMKREMILGYSESKARKTGEDYEKFIQKFPDLKSFFKSCRQVYYQNNSQHIDFLDLDKKISAEVLGLETDEEDQN